MPTDPIDAGVPTPIPTPAPKPPAEPADIAPLAIAERMTAAARALHTAGIIDLDAGLALLEETIRAQHFDAAAAVKQLQSLKPVLFAPRASSAALPRATMAHAAAPADPRETLMHAAERAANTGDRNAVLSYQRLKREAIGLTA